MDTNNNTNVEASSNEKAEQDEADEDGECETTEPVILQQTHQNNTNDQKCGTFGRAKTVVEPTLSTTIRQCQSTVVEPTGLSSWNFPFHIIDRKSLYWSLIGQPNYSTLECEFLENAKLTKCHFITS